MNSPIALVLSSPGSGSTAVAARLGSQNASRVRDLALVVGGAALTVLGAKISIPLEPVPFTLQTFAVLLCGVSLGSRLGLASQVLYVLLGLVGLPVFQGDKAGWAVLVGPTAGYLVGFWVAAWLLGRFAESGWDRRPLKLGVALSIGIVTILGLGFLWLSMQIGGRAAFQHGVAPFLPGEILKALATTALLPTAWLLVRRNQS